MTLISLLGIARSALLTHQRALDVTGHNVANAMTPGYTRQRLDLVPASPLQLPWGTMGRGVTDSGVHRVRDWLLDSSVHRESGYLGYSQTLGTFLTQAEAAINEPSEYGVGAALDGLLDAFSELANDPSSSVHRGLVQQHAGRFVDRLHQLDSSIQGITRDAMARLRATVEEVNRIASEIAGLNSQILAAGGPLHSAPDLEDQRDLLIDQLSGSMGVRVMRRDDGTVAVAAGDTLLVDAGMSRTLEVRAVAGGGTGIGVQGGGDVNPRSGSLQGMMDLINVELPGLRGRLDQFAAAVVAEVNAIHRTGFTASGATNTDFFDPAGVTAHTINLASGVAASVDAIAAGGTSAAGDGSVALQLAGLRSTPIAALGDSSLGDFYTETVTSFGASVLEARETTAAHQTLLDRAQAMRASSNGVSVDEEMVLLIAQQQAFAAATRLVTVANEMVDDILRMV
jgi:flagellar hook-associated protein 1 FlgK